MTARADRRGGVAGGGVARSDHNYSDAERQTVLASVQNKFGLSAAEAQEVLALAEAESREAHDIFQFTSKIDASFSPEQKVRLIEELWRAAYADSVLHEYEEHLIRRIADMLHLSHSHSSAPNCALSEVKFIVVTYGTSSRAISALSRVLCRALMDAVHEAHLLADRATLGAAARPGVPATALAGDIRGTL